VVLEGLRHVGDVGIPRLRERRGHADVDHVAAGELREVGGGAQPPLDHDLGDLARDHVLDVGAALGERVHLLGIEVEALHGVAGLGELDGQGQADVAEPDHPDHRLAALDSLPQILESVHRWLPSKRPRK
jgi:hypothetical protein